MFLGVFLHRKTLGKQMLTIVIPEQWDWKLFSRSSNFLTFLKMTIDFFHIKKCQK